jgi:hypothetical protein
MTPPMTNDAPAQASVEALMKAIRRAEEGAGTLPAKEAVKLRPSDWHAVCRLARALSPPPTVGAEDERDRLAKLVEGMLNEPVFAKSPHARMAIAIAARNVRRGRALTAEEKFDNLTAAIEEDDPELANRLHSCIASEKGGA